MPDPEEFHEREEAAIPMHCLNKLTLQRTSKGDISSSLADDDLTGMRLDAGEVIEARAKEVKYVKEKGVYSKITRKEAQARGWKIIKTRWIDINKGDNRDLNSLSNFGICILKCAKSAFLIHFSSAIKIIFAPLEKAFSDLNVLCWASGVRKGQTKNRQSMSNIDCIRERLTLRPLLNWSKKDIFYYMEKNKLPQHPLFEKGYSTVGDWHSSGAENTNTKGRSTRFGGLSEECGIHLNTQ